MTEMEKTTVDIIIENASELLTLRGSSKPRTGKEMSDLGIITNGAVAIKDSRIAAVGTSREIRDQFQTGESFDAIGKTVMPGFVDPHTHALFSGSREHELEMKLRGATYLDILKSGGGILRTVRETRGASAESLLANGKEILSSMLKYGSTTVEIKSGYGLTVEAEKKILHVINKLARSSFPGGIVPTFLGAHAVPEEYSGKTADYVKLLTDKMIPDVAAESLAEFCDAPCEIGFFNPDQAKEILLSGKKHGMLSKVHADEFAPSGGAQVAAEVEAVSADHMIFSPWNELEQLAKRRTTIAVLLPSASFTLFMKEYAKARAMIDAGIPVALGTDFSPSCWNMNMQMSIALACYQLKMTPSECITASTINAAHAINRAGEIGSLEEGKKADLIVLKVPNHNFLGYTFGANIVTEVFKAGQHVVRDLN
jgi:imidazolonepropionase